MNKILKIILTGAIAGQCVYWIPRLAHAGAIEDGGMMITVAAICDVWPNDYALGQLYLDAAKEEGIEDIDLLSAMMKKKGSEYIPTFNMRLIKPADRYKWCKHMRDFYIERNSLGVKDE